MELMSGCEADGARLLDVGGLDVGGVRFARTALAIALSSFLRMSRGAIAVTTGFESQLTVVSYISVLARLSRRHVSLKEIAADAVASVQDGLEQRRPQLTVVGLDKDITLVGDYVRLSPVVTNLLSNSVRYTPAGGRILLSAACETDGKMVTVAVRDNGRGIAAEDLASACNPLRAVTRRFKEGKSKKATLAAHASLHTNHGLG
jgi:signal transduction histidine kinase